MVSSIRAAVMVAPGRLEIREFPRPELADGAALLKVEMCGICGTDLHTWRGETRQYADTASEGDTPFPIIPGHEIIGILAEIDDRSGPRLDFDGQPLSVGDRVAICPDVVCGTCYGCRHRFAFPWCDHLQGYGNFVDTGEVPISPHRHLCSRNVHLIGMTNHPFTGYIPSMELLEREADRFPFERFVTHAYPLAQAAEALARAAQGDCMKVVLTP